MLKQKISVALLLCDTPSPPVLAAHGTYLPIFTSLLQDSLKNAGREDDVELVVDGYQVTNSELPPISRFEEGKEGSYDAILMTGSGRSRSSLVLSSPMLTLPFDLFVPSAATSYDDVNYPWVPPILRLLRDVGDNHSHVRIIGVW